MKDKPDLGPAPSMDRIQAIIDQARFEESPILIIDRFVSCFATDGRQTFDVPKHVLEALAAKFRLFLHHDAQSLDDAFGGQTGRQRQALNRAKSTDKIAKMMLSEINAQRATPRSKRDPGTPYDVASETLGNTTGTSADNIQRLYKLAKSGDKKKAR